MNHFTADLHLDHERIWQSQHPSYPTLQAYSDDLIEEINIAVSRKDTLHVLGDTAIKDFHKYRHRIRCQNVHLTIGNHDRRSNDDCYSSTTLSRVVKVNGKEGVNIDCYLSHYPTAYWPGSHHGHLHLYGHTHDQRETTLDAAFPGRRSMDCGILAALRLLGRRRPFSEHEVYDILAQKPGHDLKSFYEPFVETL